MRSQVTRFQRYSQTLAALLLLLPGAAMAQQRKEAAKWPQLLEDGQPDVQGYWVAKDYGMGCLKNPKDEVGCIDPPEGRVKKDAPEVAPSRVIDTPDGEVPYQPWAKEREQGLLRNFFEPTSPAHIDPQQLCLPLGAVRQLTWHDVHILQYPGYVVFVHEGGHSFRVIPLDGRPHIGDTFKLWMGDSRGHWEGTTLVVDVTNNNSKGRLSRAGDFASDKVHVSERFTFLDGNDLRYEARFDDPSVYTRPWTFGFGLKRDVFGNYGTDQATYEHWEEACYEGMNEVDRSLHGAGEEK